MRTARFSCRLWVVGGMSARGVSAQGRCTPPPFEQNDWQIGVKALPCPKLRLRAVTNCADFRSDEHHCWFGRVCLLLSLFLGITLRVVQHTRWNTHLNRHSIWVKQGHQMVTRSFRSLFPKDFFDNDSLFVSMATIRFAQDNSTIANSGSRKWIMGRNVKFIFIFSLPILQDQ